MFASKQQQLPVPEIAPAPPTPPSFAATSGAGTAQRGKATGGLGSTILTSGQGDLLPVNTGRKTLLGQ